MLASIEAAEVFPRLCISRSLFNLFCLIILSCIFNAPNMIILRIAVCDYVLLIFIYARCEGKCGLISGTDRLGGPSPVPS